MLPDQSKWDSALIEKVRSTRYDEHAGNDTEVAFQDRPPKPEDQDGPRRVATPRNKCRERIIEEQGAWQLSMSAKTMQLQNMLNKEPRNPTAMGGTTATCPVEYLKQISSSKILPQGNNDWMGRPCYIKPMNNHRYSSHIPESWSTTMCTAYLPTMGGSGRW